MSSKMCAALSPSPISAKAQPSHAAACVYCPPFSRIPGGYALIYPGSGACHGRAAREAELAVIAHQFARGRLDRCSGPLRDAVAGEHRPRLRDRVDATFVGGGRAPRASVVVEGAEIPVSVPCACFDRLSEFLGTPPSSPPRVRFDQGGQPIRRSWSSWRLRTTRATHFRPGRACPRGSSRHSSRPS